MRYPFFSLNLIIDMNRSAAKYCLILLSMCFVNFHAAAQTPNWLDETKNEENRMPMHASYFVYENDKVAAKNDWKLAANYYNLNGAWKFKWVEKPADLRSLHFGFHPDNEHACLHILECVLRNSAKMENRASPEI